MIVALIRFLNSSQDVNLEKMWKIGFQVFPIVRDEKVIQQGCVLENFIEKELRLPPQHDAEWNL